MQQRAIIVVPGFKGSRLVDRGGRIVWLTVPRLLSRRSPLRPAWREQQPDYTALQPAGVLDAVSFPWLPVGQQVYGPLLRQLETACGAGTRIIAMGWDWRQAPWRAAANLDDTVEMCRRDGVSQIQLLSHSMGSLVVAWWLLYGKSAPRAPRPRLPGNIPLDWTSIVGAFGGSAKMFRVLQIGDQVGRNRALLDAQTLAMFESSWVLLPRTPFVRTSDGAPWPEPLDDTTTWGRRGWRPFAAETSRRLPGIASWASRILNEARGFFDRLEAGTLPGDLRRITNIVANQRPTLDHVFAHPDGHLVLTSAARDRDPVFRHCSLSAPGDGTLTIAAMSLPRPFRGRAEQHTLRGEHVGILASRELHRLVLALHAAGS